jgi:hypothetical protein
MLGGYRRSTTARVRMGQPGPTITQVAFVHSQSSKAYLAGATASLTRNLAIGRRHWTASMIPISLPLGRRGAYRIEHGGATLGIDHRGAFSHQEFSGCGDIATQEMQQPHL